MQSGVLGFGMRNLTTKPKQIFLSAKEWSLLGFSLRNLMSKPSFFSESFKRKPIWTYARKFFQRSRKSQNSWTFWRNLLHRSKTPKKTFWKCFFFLEIGSCIQKNSIGPTSIDLLRSSNCIYGDSNILMFIPRIFDSYKCPNKLEVVEVLILNYWTLNRKNSCFDPNNKFLFIQARGSGLLHMKLEVKAQTQFLICENCSLLDFSIRNSMLKPQKREWFVGKKPLLGFCY